MRKGIGKVLGFLFGFVLVAGAAAGIYFGMRNQNNNGGNGGGGQPVDPVNPDNPDDIIIPIDEPDYIYTDEERIALEESFKKTQGIDLPDDQIPTKGTPEYADYQIKLAVAESMPEIFVDNHVSNESLGKIVNYLNDDNIDFSLDLSKMLKIISVEKSANSSSVSADLQLNIFEIVNQVTEVINNIARVNEYNSFGLSSQKLANIVTDVIGKAIQTRVDVAKDYKKIHNDELIEATKNVDLVANRFEDLYINGKAFSQDKKTSLYNKLYNIILNNQLIEELVDEYYDEWVDAVTVYTNDSMKVYDAARNALNNGYDNFANLKEYLENDYSDKMENCDGYQLVLALFYEEYYEEYFKNDRDGNGVPIARKTVVSGLIKEFLASKQVAEDNTYFTSAKDVESIKEYVLKLAKNIKDSDVDNDPYDTYLQIGRMANDIKNIQNKTIESFDFDLNDTARMITKVANKIKDSNYYDGSYNLDQLDLSDPSDVYRFLQDWGPGLGLSDILGKIDYNNGGYLWQEFESDLPYEIRLTVYVNGSEYTVYHDLDLTEDEEIAAPYVALLQEFVDEFRADASAIYESQNDLLVALLKVFGSDVTSTLNKLYPKVQKYFTKLVSLEIKIASAGANMISVLDTSELKDLINGIATGDYDHEYVAKNFADKLNDIADKLKSKLSPNGKLIDMTEDELKEAVDQSIIYPVRSIFSIAYSLGLVDMTDIEDIDNIEELTEAIMRIIESKGRDGNPLSLLYPVMKIVNQTPAYATRFTGAYNQLYNGLISAVEYIAQNAQTEDEYFSTDYLSDVMTALVNDVKEEKDDIENKDQQENNQQQEDPDYGKNLKEVFSDARFPLMLLKVLVAFADGAGLSEPEYRNELLPGETELPSKQEQYIAANQEFFDLAALFMKVTGIGVERPEGEEPEDIMQTITSALKFLMSDMVSADSTVIDDTIEEMRPTQLKFVEMIFIFTELFETVENMDLTVQEIGDDGQSVTRGLTYDELILQLVSEKLRDYVAQNLVGESTTGEMLLIIDDGQEHEEEPEPTTYYYRIEAVEGGFDVKVWDEDGNFLDVDIDGPLSVIYGELLNEVNNMVVAGLEDKVGMVPAIISEGIDRLFDQLLPMVFEFPLPFTAKTEITGVLVDVLKDLTDGIQIAEQLKNYLIFYLLNNAKLPF